MIRLSDDAVSDLSRLRNFLLRENPRAAAQALAAIRTAINQLIEFPELGKPTADPEIRQLSTRFGRSGYIIYYVPNPTTNIVVITRIWHGREARE